jgi:hypothetical protein
VPVVEVVEVVEVDEVLVELMAVAAVVVVAVVAGLVIAGRVLSTEALVCGLAGRVAGRLFGRLFGRPVGRVVFGGSVSDGSITNESLRLGPTEIASPAMAPSAPTATRYGQLLRMRRRTYQTVTISRW